MKTLSTSVEVDDEGTVSLDITGGKSGLHAVTRRYDMTPEQADKLISQLSDTLPESNDEDKDE